MTKFEDNQSPYLTLLESAAPGTPASGLGKLYEKTDGNLFFKNDAGTESQLTGGSSGIAATIFDAKGDIIVASAADTAVRMAAGVDYSYPRWRAAATNGLEAVLPPGHEFDYVEFTSPVSPTATTEATADTVVTGSAVTYDGSTVVVISFFSPWARPSATTAADLSFWLYDGSSSIGRIGLTRSAAAQNQWEVISCWRRLTPSAASHTYSVRASVSTGTGSIQGGAGGNGAEMPGFIRIIKAN